MTNSNNDNFIDICSVVDNNVLNEKELQELNRLTERYEKIIEPGILAKTGKKISEVIPPRLKAAATDAGETITGQQFYETS